MQLIQTAIPTKFPYLSFLYFAYAFLPYSCIWALMSNNLRFSFTIKHHTCEENSNN